MKMKKVWKLRCTECNKTFSIKQSFVDIYTTCPDCGNENLISNAMKNYNTKPVRITISQELYEYVKKYGEKVLFKDWLTPMKEEFEKIRISLPKEQDYIQWYYWNNDSWVSHNNYTLNYNNLYRFNDNTLFRIIKSKVKDTVVVSREEFECLNRQVSEMRNIMLHLSTSSDGRENHYSKQLKEMQLTYDSADNFFTDETYHTYWKKPK